MATKKKRTVGELVQGSAPYGTAATRSAHVRAYLQAHRKPGDRKPSAIVKHFADHGITLSAALVSQVKPKRVKKTSDNGTLDPLDSLLAAKKLLDLTGGDLAVARKSLDIVKKVRD